MKKITYYLSASIFVFTAIASANASTSTYHRFNEKKYLNIFTAMEQQTPCYASKVIKFVQGSKTTGLPIDANRSNPDKALNTPDKSNDANGFVSLGVNGSITVGFSGVIYDSPGVDIKIYETSFSGDQCGASDDEKATIELSQDGITWINYGVVCRDGEIDISGLGLYYVSQIRITNHISTTTSDGYDLDGIEVINGCQEAPSKCYGSEVITYKPSDSNGPIDPARLDPAKALGEPQGENTSDFTALGYGGYLTIGFTDNVVYNNPGDDIIIAEITHGSNLNFSNYPESAAIYVSQNNVDFFILGTVITKESKSFDISSAIGTPTLEYITRVKIVDTTPQGSVSNDGFDVDGIIVINGCSAAPKVELAGCNATEYLEYVPGTNKNGSVLSSIRTNPENALKIPEMTDTNIFTTLGYNGHITLAFDGAIMNGPGNDLKFIETSFNQNNGCTNYPEFATIYVSTDNVNWHLAGTICKENNQIDISNAGDFDYIYYIKVENNNELSTTEDGYDLDGVIVLHNCEVNNNEEDQKSLGLSQKTIFEATSYPNPTTGTMKISFESPESNIATVSLFDTNGRVLKVLTKQTQVGEQNDIDFDASNLSSGVYFYKVTVGDQSLTKKFAVNR